MNSLNSSNSYVLNQNINSDLINLNQLLFNSFINKNPEFDNIHQNSSNLVPVINNSINNNQLILYPTQHTLSNNFNSKIKNISNFSSYENSQECKNSETSYIQNQHVTSDSKNNDKCTLFLNQNKENCGNFQNIVTYNVQLTQETINIAIKKYYFGVSHYLIPSIYILYI